MLFLYVQLHAHMYMTVEKTYAVGFSHEPVEIQSACSEKCKGKYKHVSNKRMKQIRHKVKKSGSKTQVERLNLGYWRV